MTEYKYAGLIWCSNCKKSFRGKMSRKHKTYLCSGRNNYGKSFCDNDWQVKEEYLDFIIERHKGSKEVGKIEVNKNKIKISYVDSSFSYVDGEKIIF